MTQDRRIAPRKRPAPAVPVETPLLELAFRGLRPATVKLYKGDWERFLAHAGLDYDAFFALHKADAAVALDQYLSFLEESGKAPATRARAKQAICSVVDKLYAAEVAPWTLRGLSLIQSPEVAHYAETEGVSPETVRGLLTAAGSDGTRRGLRDLAVLLLLYDSALRRREVATLRLCDYDRDRALVKVWQKRRDVANRVPVPVSERTCRALDAWLATRGNPDGRGALFVPLEGRPGPSRKRGFQGDDVAYVVRFWCARIDAPVVGPHQLRHARITHLAELGVATHKLKAFARHADVNTTMHYVKTTEKDVRELTELV